MRMRRGAITNLLAPLLLGLIVVGSAACESQTRGTTPAAGVLVDTGGSGAGGQTTQVFTVDGDWDLRWSYDCSPSLRTLFRKVDHCDFSLKVKQMSDCQVSPENQGINQRGVKDQGVVHYHTGGTFYFVVGSDGPWTVTVTGSGRASVEGPALRCSEG